MAYELNRLQKISILAETLGMNEHIGKHIDRIVLIQSGILANMGSDLAVSEDSIAQDAIDHYETILGLLCKKK